MAYKNSDTARARRKKTVPEPAPAPGRRSRPPLRANRGRIERPDRASRRARDLPHHGLHHVRQPGDPREGRHGPWRRVRRHLPCRCGRLGHHGALRQLPDRSRAGHGAQRLFRLHRGARAWWQLAARPYPRFHFLGVVLRAVALAVARLADRCNPAPPQARHRRRHRLLPRSDRAAECRHRDPITP